MSWPRITGESREAGGDGRSDRTACGADPKGDNGVARGATPERVAGSGDTRRLARGNRTHRDQPRRAPNATLKVYPEAGHSVHWERPEQVVRDLEAIMKDTRPAH